MDGHFTFGGKTIWDAARHIEDLEANGIPVPPGLRQCNSFTEVRGRHSSVGKFLMLREDLDDLRNIQEPRHTLKIWSGGKAIVEVEDLFVSDAQAINANLDATGKAHERTPYVVTVSDLRYYLNRDRRTGGNEWINPVEWFASEARDQKGATQLIGGLASNAGMDVTFDSRDRETIDELKIHNLRVFGEHNWGVLWQVLDSLGLTIEHVDGGWVVKLLKDDYQAPVGQLAGHLMDGSAWILNPTMPESVRVAIPNHDYQFGAIAACPADFHRANPIEVIDVDVSSGPAGVETLAGDVKSLKFGGSVMVWGTMPKITNDRGEWVNEVDVREHAESIAKRHAQRARFAERRLWWEYAGAWNPQRSNRYPTTIWRQNVRGFTTTLSASTLLPDEWGMWSPMLFEPMPPNSMGDHPHSREIYVRIDGPLADPLSPSAGDDGPSGQKTIAADMIFRGTSLTGKRPLVSATDDPTATSEEQNRTRLADFVEWEAAKEYDIVNATGGPVDVGGYGFARWNYQLGTGGMWCLIAAGGKEKDCGCGGGDDCGCKTIKFLKKLMQSMNMEDCLKDELENLERECCEEQPGESVECNNCDDGEMPATVTLDLSGLRVKKDASTVTPHLDYAVNWLNGQHTIRMGEHPCISGGCNGGKFLQTVRRRGSFGETALTELRVTKNRDQWVVQITHKVASGPTPNLPDHDRVVEREVTAPCTFNSGQSVFPTVRWRIPATACKEEATFNSGQLDRNVVGVDPGFEARSASGSINGGGGNVVEAIKQQLQLADPPTAGFSVVSDGQGGFAWQPPGISGSFEAGQELQITDGAITGVGPYSTGYPPEPNGGVPAFQPCGGSGDGSGGGGGSGGTNSPDDPACDDVRRGGACVWQQEVTREDGEIVDQTTNADDGAWND